MTFAEVEAWVRANLPPAPARVLEVGAGDGELSRRLRDAGYEVTAIDPKSDSPDVEPVALADLPLSRPYDAAVAVVSLHHVEPLDASVARLADALADGAPLLLDEFDVGALDERTATQWLAWRRSLGDEEAESPTELIETMRSKVHAIDLLSSTLAPHFDVGEPARGTYLYRWKLGEPFRAEEERLVASGELAPTGVRIIARRRARSPRDAPPGRGRRVRARRRT